MKQYLLLRDNQQSGPHSFIDLTSLGLLETDLVWIEDESSAWSYTTEIEELKPFTTKPVVREKKIYVSQPPSITAVNRAIEEEVPVQVNICQSPVELKERLNEFHHKSPIWNRQGSSVSNILQVAAVFGGLMVGAFLIKKAVDGFGNMPVAENYALPAQVIAEESQSEDYKNALLTEVIPVKDSVKKESKKIVRPRDIKKQLSIQGSEYKVGMLGGVSGLYLKVRNASPHSVDRITVAVQYMKPNGDVVHTDRFELEDIKPYGLKTLQVPDSKRGVKVKYSIVEVRSKDYTRAIKQV
jgi:hypothetical protein